MKKTALELREALRQAQAFYRRATVAVPHAMPEIKGIFLGGCVNRGVGSSFRAQAHAHNDHRDGHFGWVCFRSIKRLGQYAIVECDDGTAEVHITKPGKTLIHEYAHILVPNQGHTDRWRAMMLKLGQRLPQRYHKKVRAKR